MTRERGLLVGLVRLCATLAVVCTLAAGVGAAVVQAGEEEPSSGSGDGTEPSESRAPEPTDDPFTEGDFRYDSWVQQQDSTGVRYRVPPGWRPRPPAEVIESVDATGAVAARGSVGVFYYGNDCSQGTPVPGAWALLAESVEGDDAEAAAQGAALAWARSVNHAGGTEAPISDPVTETVELNDGTAATRAWVSVDMSVLAGTCTPDRAEVAVTAVPRDGEVISLVQMRYVLDPGGVTDVQWSAISASLEVE